MEMLKKATDRESKTRKATNHPTLIGRLGLKQIIAVSLVLMVTLLLGVEYLSRGIRSTVSTEPLRQTRAWEAAKLLLQSSDEVGLHVFVIEPSLLRAVHDGSKGSVDLWRQQPQTFVTFGVNESESDSLHQVISAMHSKGYMHWEKQDEDPRGVTSAKRGSNKNITTHVLLWVPAENHTPILIHLVVFFERHGYLWHTAVQDKFQVPPFNLGQSLFGQNAGAYSMFGLSTVYIDDVKVDFPDNPFAFLKETLWEFIECNQTQAQFFNTNYGLDKKDDRYFEIRETTKQLLSRARNALKPLNIPFWISSGTCLGWLRQCDIIQYTNDVDIEIFIEDYNENLTTALKAQGLRPIHSFGKISDSFQIAFSYGGLKLDIFFLYTTDEYVWDGGVETSSLDKYKQTYQHFKLCWTEFVDVLVHVPCPTLPYIEAIYGSKWRSPIKDWDWKSSPHNIKKNGQWPKEERHEVVKVYR